MSKYKLVKRSQEPFKESDIEDVRIIIKAKGKHWGIVPKDSVRELAEQSRRTILDLIMPMHYIVDCPLEDLLSMKNGEKLNLSEKD